MAATSPEILVDPSASGGRSVDRRHIAALTGLRGLAALVVVVVHSSGATAYPWVGVHGYGPIALFVLSGFLLFQPWSKWMLAQAARPRLGTFLRRRVLRIFPAYLVTLTLVALVYPPSRPKGVDGWLRSLTLTQTTRYDGLRPGMEHTWSLSTELTWYVALPLLGAAVAMLVLRRGVRPMVAMTGLLVAGLAVTVAWRVFLYTQVDELAQRLTMPYWLPAFIVCFLGGAFVSHVLLTVRYGSAGSSPLHWFAARPWLVIAMVLVTAAIANSRLGGEWGWTLHTRQERSIRFAFTTLMALTLLVGVAAARPGTLLQTAFSSRVMVAIGRWSYGIYLWHLPVREIFIANMDIPSGPAGLIIWLGLQLAIAVPLGAATYAFVERPAIAWSKRGRPPSREPVQHPS